jgi:hypothetical protein
MKEQKKAPDGLPHDDQWVPITASKDARSQEQHQIRVSQVRYGRDLFQHADVLRE